MNTTTKRAGTLPEIETSLKVWRSVWYAWPWLILLLFVLFMVGIGISGLITGQEGYTGFIVVVPALAPAYLPCLFIHISYWLEERLRKITLQKNMMQIDYRFTGASTVIGRNDIYAVYRHQVKASTLLWGSYEYLELQLHNGRRYYITCLVIEPEVVIHYLALNRVQECRRIFPAIKRNRR